VLDDSNEHAWAESAAETNLAPDTCPATASLSESAQSKERSVNPGLVSGFWLDGQSLEEEPAVRGFGDVLLPNVPSPPEISVCASQVEVQVIHQASRQRLCTRLAFPFP